MKTDLTSFAVEVCSCTSLGAERAAISDKMQHTRLVLHLNRPPHKKAKYLWRMVYAHCMGYTLDFGQTAALVLLQSCTKPSVRLIAYISLSYLALDAADQPVQPAFPQRPPPPPQQRSLAPLDTALAMDEGAQASQDLQRRHVPTEQELQPGWWMQLRNALKADLRSGMPVLQCLALQHVGVACLSRSPRGAEAAATTADELLPLVNGLANPAGRSPPCCRQRAYAALLCLYKASPRQQKEHQQQEGVWIYRLTQCLMIEQDSDALLGLSHLLMELLLRKRCARSDRSTHGKKQSVHSPRAIDDATGGWEAVRSSVLHCLSRLLWGGGSRQQQQQQEQQQHSHNELPQEQQEIQAPFLVLRLMQLLQLLPAPTAAAEIQTANQTLRLCFDRIAQAGTLNRPSTAGRRRWPFSRSFGGNSGSAAASVSSSATATMRLQQRGSLWTRAVARSRTAAASLRRSASVSRAAAGSADQQQELHQQGFDVPLLHAAMLIEVAKAALSLGQAIAPDVVERAIDIISILVADPRADVRLTAAEGILSLLHDRSKISRFAFLLPAALELAAEPTDLVLQQAVR
ncbi:uncharacterized protein LOC113147559 [Cyclospora cayetanensis]|uniref:Uncharacterized protein LOC113147559 n=1 Tax=Cyclospora cayetanensis TaxID=88456 RepID=A0A6P6S3A0_9EIME|nr:uncharacterized protein LOC113147559 [Cyclospora cayetanensis]